MKARFFRIPALLLVFVLSCIFFVTPISAAYALDSQHTLSFITESVELFISDLLNEGDTYSSFRDTTLLYMYPLYDSTASNIIAHYYELATDHMVGYLIVDSETGSVLEFSATNCGPYENIQTNNSLQNGTECKRVYCYWDYGVVDGNYIVFQNSGTKSLSELSVLNQNIHISDAGAILVSTNLALNSVRSVSGFEYYLQNTRNCVIAAMAHIITFWGQSCPNLCNVTDQTSFNALMDTLTTYANQNGGVGINANIPPTFQAYVNGIGSLSYSYTVSAENIWSPTISQLIVQINAGRPVMLGYTTWNTSSPHMTVCTNVEYRSGSYYVTLATGHTVSPVERIWDTSINDFICRVSFSAT